MLIQRLIQLHLGLFVYGASLALLVRADLGLDPWNVFHQGFSQHTGLSFGLTVNLVGFVILLAWWPLKIRPGLGTVMNVLLIGPSADLWLWLIPEQTDLVIRAIFFASGLAILALATAAYIGAGFGPGPRDGLMTGINARTGWPIGLIRTGIELSVLAAGFVLGGSVGLGTVLFAVLIGPLIQPLLPIFKRQGASVPKPTPAE